MKQGAIVFLIFVVFIGINLIPKKIATFPDIYRPSMMDISNNEVYILDGYSVKVYSLDGFRFLREFGKKGEGPGELSTTSDTGLTMIVKGENVYLNSVYKIIVYGKTGKIIKEKKFRDFLVEAVPIGENYVLTFFKWIEGTAHAITKLSDKDFQEKKVLYKSKLPQSHRIRKISIPQLCTYVRTSKDKIFLFDQQKDVIKVFDKKGNPKPDIVFKYDKIMTTQDFRNKTEGILFSNPAMKKLPKEVQQEYWNCQKFDEKK